MKKVLLVLFIIISILDVFAQDAEPRPYIKKGFVIIQSTKSYDSAKTTAISASKKLTIKLDLRGLKPDKKNGLTFPKEQCINDYDYYPCYIARGYYDNGTYVSVEWSDAYEGFSKGYYIVIIASGENELTKPALAKARKKYAGAYTKTTEVYVGCMH